MMAWKSTRQVQQKAAPQPSGSLQLIEKSGSQLQIAVDEPSDLQASLAFSLHAERWEVSERR